MIHQRSAQLPGSTLAAKPLPLPLIHAAVAFEPSAPNMTRMGIHVAPIRNSAVVTPPNVDPERIPDRGYQANYHAISWVFLAPGAIFRDTWPKDGRMGFFLTSFLVYTNRFSSNGPHVSCRWHDCWDAVFFAFCGHLSWILHAWRKTWAGLCGQFDSKGLALAPKAPTRYLYS